MISIPGYQVLDKLHDGNKSVVYRGVKDSNQKPIVLKVLKNEFPRSEELAGCKREFDLIQDLPIPGVIQSHDLVKCQNSLAIVFEDFGGDSLKKILPNRRFEMEERLLLALKITLILGQIHQHNIIHKDINPANIVWNPKTNQIKIIDFCCSNRLPRERPSIFNPTVLIGNLVYISPEQTGRMNRSVDYRSDFYALGVTFYEIFTGQIPFDTKDPSELVHCHIAKQPLRPERINPAISTALSGVITKLMSKNAEDRYQSAYGIAQDLEICLEELHSKVRKTNFIAGQHDVSSQFHIPEKFYGRDKEIDLLMQNFEHVAMGDKRLMVISGHPGIGKTSLVNEIHKPVVRRRGFFISGKFDQFQRNVPYSSLITAFKELVRHLLSESTERIEFWEASLINALGKNAKVIIDVIPDIELIIGNQPDVIDLPPLESQNRFNLAFRQFIGVFARPEHPLILFLDDLQWAGTASLNLIQSIFQASEINHFLLLGAYRSNEVSDSHPLTLTIDRIQETGQYLQRIYLSPLQFVEMNQLISDTLHCSLEESRELTKLVSLKTDGNPLFVNQFIQSLYENRLVEFQVDTGKWKWDIQAIREIDITDNVVELMANKIQKLSQRTVETLKLASCIGNQFSLSMLSVISNQTLWHTAAELWQGLQEGLILPLHDKFGILQSITDRKSIMPEEDSDPESLYQISYRFLHDRVQQAAYSLIPPNQLKEIHLKIGRLLLAEADSAVSDQLLFDITNHLNYGKSLITEKSEKLRLIKLNLAAGKKSKSALAFEPALSFFNSGIELLEADSWDSEYSICLDLHIESSETAYLSTDFALTEKLANEALRHAKSLLDRVRVYDVRMQSLYAQNRMKEVIDQGLRVLKLLGHRFPRNPGTGHIVWHFLRTKVYLSLYCPKEFEKVPNIDNPIVLASARLLDRLGISSYRSSPKLLPLVIFRAITLSAKHGIAPESAFGYAAYGFFLCAAVGDIENGFRFGQIAEYLKEQPLARKMKPKAWFLIECQIRHWKCHIRESLEPLLEVYKAGLEVGDIEYGTLATNIYCIYSFLAGRSLEKLRSESLIYTKATEDFQQSANLNYQQIVLQTIINLIDCPEQPHMLTGEVYQQPEKKIEHIESEDETALYQAAFFQMVLAYLFGDYPLAVESSEAVITYEESVLGMYYMPASVFYQSLSFLAVAGDSPDKEKKDLLKQVSKNLKKMKKWAKFAPMNHQHKVYLVEAEIARVKGNRFQAIDGYNRAIEGAAKFGFINEEAIANELAAEFYLAEGFKKHARTHLAEARYLYYKWGAKSKVQQLEKQYDHYLAKLTGKKPNPSYSFSPETAGSADSAGEILDLSSVLKASHTISGEVELEGLLRKLMTLVIENAGAEKALLILTENGQLTIAARGELEQSSHSFNPVSMNHYENVAQTVVRYVMRTNKSMIISDATTDVRTSRDPYVVLEKLKSILCMPVKRHGTAIGSLYLENNKVTGAFTPGRIEVLQILTSQAAISIENARLYTSLKESEKKYRSIFENATEGVFQFDSDGQVLTINPAFARIVGFDSIEMLEDSIGNLGNYLFANASDRDEVFSRLSSSGAVKNFEFECKRNDGSTFPASINAHTVKDDAGNLLYWEGILEDISEKKASEKLRIAKEAAESSNQAKTEFLANMSHELRTPMHAILGFTKLGMTRMESKPKEILKSYFSEVHNSGQRLLVLLNDLLDLSKLEAGKYNYSFMAQKLSNAVSIVLDEFRGLAESQQVTIQFQKPDLEDLLHFDMEKMIQVIRNLLSNALKFSQPKSMMTVVIDDTGEAVQLSVYDQGMGIPEDELESVFDKFVQSSKTKTGSGGTGLGLAICKQIVLDHQGQIWAENNLDGGAVFKFFIPKEKEADTTASA